MAKRPLVQCRICKGKIDRDNQKDWCMPQERWYYHTACYDDFAKKRGAIKEGDIHIEVDDDMYSLSTMIQWIWRSRIRDGGEINVYVPSLRMRTLFENWLDNKYVL